MKLYNISAIWCRDQDLGPEYGPFRVLKFFRRIKDASVLYLDAHMSRWPTTQR